MRAPIDINPFYVAREWHGAASPRPLMQAATDAPIALGGIPLWLGVWERNPRAITFYAKCGFRTVSSQLYIVGDDVQTDRVLVRGLR